MRSLFLLHGHLLHGHLLHAHLTHLLHDGRVLRLLHSLHPAHGHLGWFCWFARVDTLNSFPADFEFQSLDSDGTTDTERPQDNMNRNTPRPTTRSCECSHQFNLRKFGHPKTNRPTDRKLICVFSFDMASPHEMFILKSATRTTSA